ncbi:MAG TPA: 1-acyl-sn-glycerol-3-phosphate acyltransferase [Kofleriaceae bacterium]|nr:1-acyl-sn-glycerol-3-phosphate acyltransferase [Kofleriaceae bacterium]
MSSAHGSDTAGEEAEASSPPGASARDAAGAANAARDDGFARGSRPISVLPRALADVDVRGLVTPDPLPRRVLRRLVTFTILFVLTAVWWGLSPLVLLVMAVADLVRRRPMLLARFYLTTGAILFGQVWGVLLTGCVWVWSGFGLDWRRQNRGWLWAQGLWADWNKRAMGRIYDIDYVVEGSELLRDGPTIMLMRHASINDTILPIALITRPHDVRLRIVLKAELLNVPVVDVMGRRVPNAFVKRGSGNPERELDQVRVLTRDLHPDETIMIFPEGTRYTPERREAILARLQTKDPAAAAEAEALHHTLPLRLGGTHALIDAAPHADLIICAHTGYESSAKLADFVRGGLYRATVRVKFWRIPAGQVPTDHAARAAFLHEEWKKVDAWIGEHRARRN